MFEDRDLHAEWLGRIDYDAAVLRMQTQSRARREGLVQDTLLLCEHPPTLTLGRRADAAEILASPEMLDGLGVHVARCDRGGLATYHGPGQLVGYPIVWVGRAPGAGAALARVCGGVLVDVARACGVAAHWRDDAPGAWTLWGKLGAVGLRIEDGVSRHGFALNVQPDLAHFTLIVSCGMSAARTTSVFAETGCAPTVEAVATLAAESFAARWRQARPTPPR